MFGLKWKHGHKLLSQIWSELLIIKNGKPWELSRVKYDSQLSYSSRSLHVIIVIWNIFKHCNLFLRMSVSFFMQIAHSVLHSIHYGVESSAFGDGIFHMTDA